MIHIRITYKSCLVIAALLKQVILSSSVITEHFYASVRASKQHNNHQRFQVITEVKMSVMCSGL